MNTIRGSTTARRSARGPTFRRHRSRPACRRTCESAQVSTDERAQSGIRLGARREVGACDDRGVESPDPSFRRHLLIESLTMLAADAQTQVAWLNKHGVMTDEIALDCGNFGSRMIWQKWRSSGRPVVGGFGRGDEAVLASRPQVPLGDDTGCLGQQRPQGHAVPDCTRRWVRWVRTRRRGTQAIIAESIPVMEAKARSARTRPRKISTCRCTSVPRWSGSRTSPGLLNDHDSAVTPPVTRERSASARRCAGHGPPEVRRPPCLPRPWRRSPSPGSDPAPW